MSAYKELELAETERDEYEAKEAIKWECREDVLEEREESCMTYDEAYKEGYEQGKFDAYAESYRYRWHDLRKNPEDVPNDQRQVYVACEYELYETDFYPFCEGTLAWREIEPFKEDNTDD